MGEQNVLTYGKTEHKKLEDFEDVLATRIAQVNVKNLIATDKVIRNK
jgi:hypothetical protein